MVLRDKLAIDDRSPLGHSRGAVEHAHALVCMGCNRATVVIEVKGDPGSQPTAVHWWPTPGTGQLDPSIPEQVGEAYDEGVRCLAVAAPHAAVTMLRGALAQVVLDKGSPAAQIQVKTNLARGISQWHTDGLHDALAQWADHTRAVGNAGAHQETYESVSMEDAEELRKLVQEFLNVIYVMPARIDRARAAGTGTKRQP